MLIDHELIGAQLAVLLILVLEEIIWCFLCILGVAQSEETWMDRASIVTRLEHLRRHLSDVGRL